MMERRSDPGIGEPVIRPMSDGAFRRFSGFIQTRVGIKMPETKRTMLQARLQRRLRELRIENFEDYFDFVMSPEGIQTELAKMIDAVTTNKTDFFREAQHFDYLVRTALPTLMREKQAGVREPALVWSAGCASGEEPYTLAMVLQEFRVQHPEFRFRVLGTDISRKVLDAAVSGIYTHEKIEPIPMPLRKKYLLRSKNRENDRVRMSAGLRALVMFRQVNFMDDDFGFRERADAVFCRNVLIYFDRNTQEAVLNRICRHLVTGGYLFTGHSETLNGLSVPLVQEASTIYRKR